MADRYTDTFPPDSPLLVDRDAQFNGMNTRLEPDKLEPGTAQLLQNIRLDNLSPTTRKGLSKQTNAINPELNPLKIPFIIGSSSVISGSNAISLLIPFIIGASSSIISGGGNGIFASCPFSDPNNNNKTYLFLATQDRAYWMDANQNVGSIFYPTNELVESIDPSTDMLQDGGNIYLWRGDVGTSFTVTSISSQVLPPLVIPFKVGAATSIISGGTVSTLAKVTTPTTTGLLTGQYVRIGGSTAAPYNGDFQITVTGTSTFTYVMTAVTVTPAPGTLTCNRLKLPLKWTGNFSSPFVTTPYGVISQNFSYMPTTNFGLLQQNRLILEYNRNGLIMSQILGPEAYDTINGVFNFNPGSADYLVGAAPYQDTQTLAFLRYSIWLVNGLNGDVAAMTTQLLTDQQGCISRRTIKTCGANVLFLNERGVFIIQPGYELTLRGNSLPLSAPIDSYIKTINFSALNIPCAAYFLNRYYLAVPTGSNTRNNTVFVYNFINEQWESIDTFPNGFYCDRMEITLNAQGVPTLYMISFEGGIYAAEQNEADDFAAASQPANQYPINSIVWTRRYLFGDMALKKFNRATVNFSLDPNSSVTCQALTYQPENTRTLPTFSSGGTSASINRPMLINMRGFGLELLLTGTTGRFELGNIQLGAYIMDRKTVGIT